MKIIGHRGAAGLALENTIASIKTAQRVGVDAVEFDVRMTSDGHFILSHDVSTKRVSTSVHNVHEQTRAKLTQLALHNGERLATLQQALDAAGTTPVFIEMKDSGWADKLAALLEKRDTKHINVIAMNHHELARFHARLPKVKTYAVQQFNAGELLETLRAASAEKFTGIDMNFWLLNPLTYYLARRSGLKVLVYTVNLPWIAWFLNVLFPEVVITTDRPDLMQFLRKPRVNKAT